MLKVSRMLKAAVSNSSWKKNVMKLLRLRFCVRFCGGGVLFVKMAHFSTLKNLHRNGLYCTYFEVLCSRILSCILKAVVYLECDIASGTGMIQHPLQVP